MPATLFVLVFVGGKLSKLSDLWGPPQAKQKLDALEAYLNAYALVMKKQKFRLFYIDAFAGAGVVRVRGKNSTDTDPDDLAILPIDLSAQERDQVVEYINGSPLRALASNAFDYYRFVDLDPNRVADLNRLAERYPGIDVKAYEREANEWLQFVASRFTDRMWRGVAFLDPYGAHLHWTSLESLAKTGKFDVIINFPLAMTINRLIKRDGHIPDTWKAQLDLCFGGEEWRDLAFTTTSGLFGEEQMKRADASELLLGYYLDRLKAIFGNVSVPSLVKNTRGAPLYYLIWAGKHPTGQRIADHILRLGDRVKVPTRRS